MSIPVLGLPYVPLAGGTATGIVIGPGFVSNLRNTASRYTFPSASVQTMFTLKPFTTTHVVVHAIDSPYPKSEMYFTTDGAGVNFAWMPASTGDADLFRLFTVTSTLNFLVTTGDASLSGKSFWITAELV